MSRLSCDGRKQRRQIECDQIGPSRVYHARVSERSDLHRVVALLSPPQSTFELACAAEVFGLTRPGMQRRYDFSICAASPGPMPTLAGYDIHVPAGLGALLDAETIVVAGWPHRESGPSQAVISALQQAHARGARLAALCSGAFLLAEAGLLNGRLATTHWRMAEDFRRRYPAARLDADVLFVDEGNIATSAGTGAAIDLCLHLVRTDFGANYAADIARHMVLPPRRDGGQLQYARNIVEPMGDALSAVMHWAERRLDEPLTLTELASFAGVSSRTLTRRFTAELGVSPGRWLLQRRVDEARVLLEQTDLTIESIADRVGLSDAANLRRRFVDQINTTPGSYRRTFRPRDTTLRGMEQKRSA